MNKLILSLALLVPMVAGATSPPIGAVLVPDAATVQELEHDLGIRYSLAEVTSTSWLICRTTRPDDPTALTVRWNKTKYGNRIYLMDISKSTFYIKDGDDVWENYSVSESKYVRNYYSIPNISFFNGSVLVKKEHEFSCSEVEQLD